jgi:hypothetical protein
VASPVVAVVSPPKKQDCTLVEKFKDWDTHLMYAICMGESKGDPNAHNYSDKSKDDSWGLMQVNLYGNLKLSRPSPEQLTNADFNIDYAHSLWLGRGLDHWGAYKDGRYKKYL